MLYNNIPQKSDS